MKVGQWAGTRVGNNLQGNGVPLRVLRKGMNDPVCFNKITLDVQIGI